MNFDEESLKQLERSVTRQREHQERLAIFLAALPYNLVRAAGLEANEDLRRTRAIEDSIRCADEAMVKLRAE